MRNRAKCKMCESIIESFHRTDYVTCNCEEIAIDGGSDFCKAYAKNWNNFMRIDDEGNEILIKIKDSEKLDTSVNEQPNKMTKREMISMLDELIKSYERLPSHAWLSPVTNSDLCSALLLISSIFKSID